MWHKPYRTFHPWCLCIKTRCLYHYCGWKYLIYLPMFFGVTLLLQSAGSLKNKYKLININTLKLRWNDRHFADDLFKCIFLNENAWISIKSPEGALPLWESVGMRRGFAPHFRHLDDLFAPQNLTMSTILFRSCWVPFRNLPFSACRRSFCPKNWPNI